jgi:hypothetical protein
MDMWIDIEEPPEGRGGRTADALPRKLFCRSINAADPMGVHFYCCVAYDEGCWERLADQLKPQRALKHGAKCNHISNNLKHQAILQLSGASASAQLDVLVASDASGPSSLS